MADENTQNPINPIPPAGDAATPPPPAGDDQANKPEEAAPAEAKPETAPEAPATTPILASAKPVEEETTPTPAVEPTSETPAETPTLASAAPVEETPEAKPEPTPPVPAQAEPEPVEIPTPQPETVEQAQEAIETQAEPVQTEVPVEEGEIISGAPSKPGDKVEKEMPEPEAEEIPAEAAPETAGTVSPPPQADGLKAGFKEDGMTPLDGEEKIFAAIGYISFLAFLPLLARRDSEFAQHHGRQATVVFVIFMFLWVFGSIINIGGIVGILQIAEFVAGFVLAYKGDWFKIPGVYDLSLKLKLKPQTAAPTSEEPPAEAPIQEDDQSQQ